jgi:hypothetical protein
MILMLKSTQNQGVTTECKREKFSRGSLDANPRELVTSEAFPLVREEEDDRRGEELLVLLS